MRKSLFLGALVLILSANAARSQGIAYGSITNFDTVNDTGHECHGFEIELEDCHSTDVGYTYDYNHYGTPRITEDNSIPAHPACHVRWESAKRPDGSWAAYTAIPAGPIAPTDGHQFTNPNVNFGGEHFGVSYMIQPSTVRYFWLIDDGAGNLVRGGQVQVAAPTFHYFPPQGAAPAQVQVAIQPPEPPEVPVTEFGPAMWVKEIRTTTHNNHEIALRDLVSDDPDDPNDANWRNGEPDEIEAEWELLQTEFSKPGLGKGLLVAGAENLDNGDEVVTRRYEFFEYSGPFDEESGEAKAGRVGADGVHGEGVTLIDGVEVDLSTIEVVGAYRGAQMAAVIADASVGLIDHLADGFINELYADRSVVIPGNSLFTATSGGVLPPGMSFDPVTGILAGTPLETGVFAFSVTASDETNPGITKNYRFRVWEPGAEIPASALVDTSASPPEGGTTSGDGTFLPGEEITVVATSAPGFAFLGWTESGATLSTSVSYSFTADVNHSLVAQFEPAPQPDLTIGTTFSVQVGDGVYNNDATGQTIRQAATKKRKAVFYFKVENDSAAPDSITLTATRSDKRIGAAYFDLSNGRRNVTAALTKSLLPAELGASGGKSFMAVVAIHGKRVRRVKSFLIAARSAGDARDRAASVIRFK
jgi:hypothetical protein